MTGPDSQSASVACCFLQQPGADCDRWESLLAVVCLAANTTGVRFNRFLKQFIGVVGPETGSVADPEYAQNSCAIQEPQVRTRSER